MPRFLLLPLASDTTSAGEARAHLRRFLAGGDRREGAAAEVVVSELVTNAIVHGVPPIRLRLSRLGMRVRIEVSDGDRHVGAIALHQPEEPADRGRGLQIVAALAQRWGVIREARGKTVWAEVSLQFVR